MHILYLASVWLHILAATVWIGGMFFLVLVLVPWLRSAGREQAGLALRETGLRFRKVGWICFGVLIATGAVNLWMRGVRPADFARHDFWAAPFGSTLLLKLASFALVLALSALHDFGVGPRATRALARDARTPETARLRRMASWLGRLNLLLALVIVALAVMLVRGAPW